MNIVNFIYLITMGILLLVEFPTLKKDQQQKIKLIKIAVTFAWIGFNASQIMPK